MSNLPVRDPFCPPSYWDILKDTWAHNRVASCVCEYCHGIDICTIQMCWNKFYGPKVSGTNSAIWAVAKANPVTAPVVTAPMHCVTCNEKNDWAEPNRADGTYECFGCRT